MLFLNPWLLLGLAGVLIPIILHMMRRQAAKPLDWGAMRFLFDTVAMLDKMNLSAYLQFSFKH